MLPAVTSRNLESTRWRFSNRVLAVVFPLRPAHPFHTESEGSTFQRLYEHRRDSLSRNGRLRLTPASRLSHAWPRAQCALVDGEGEDLGAFDERREWIVGAAQQRTPMRGELITYSASRREVSAAHRTTEKTLELDAHSQSREKSSSTPSLLKRRWNPTCLRSRAPPRRKSRQAKTFRPDPDFAKSRPNPFNTGRSPPEQPTTTKPSLRSPMGPRFFA